MADLLDLEPTAMAAGGDALAREPGGRVVFVAGALPGERVRARLTEERRDYARGVAVEVLAPSPDRVAPPCPALAAGCGGCTWQHVSAEGQVRLKAAVVVDALRRIGRMADPPEPVAVPLPAPALRTTARLAVTEEGRAGHRRRGGDEAVPTASCLAAHPLLEELIVHGSYPGAGEVLLRAGVASGERVVSARRRAGQVVVPAGVLVVSEKAARRGFVHEEVAGRRFRISAASFFQPGPVAAAALAEAVVEAAGDGAGAGPVVDAYAGVGLFASVLGAASGSPVTAVESSPAAAADARANLSDLDARVVTIEVGRWKPPSGAGRPALVVADPARSGLGRPGAAALAAAGAPRLVLVSCDPASLGRDAGLLATAGYRLTSVALVDAFPHTFHVETVSRFDR
ncbi:MAG: class I SAM-dependent RNA methyltransferase [Actinomycetota bacterium]